jgi:hypothetical protein
MDPAQPQSPQPPQPSSGPQSTPSPRGDPGVRWVLVRAAALGLLIVIGIVAIVWLVSIPLFSPAQSPVRQGPVPTVTAPPGQPVTSSPSATTTITSPTVDQLPKNSEVLVSVVPKDLAGRVTVRLDGGPGRSMVKEIVVKLTQPDGTVDTRSMELEAEFPEVTVNGSRETDHLEVFVMLRSGKIYKVIDEPVPYRQHF